MLTSPNGDAREHVPEVFRTASPVAGQMPDPALASERASEPEPPVAATTSDIREILTRK
jgi:hypothetical protein